MDYEPIGKPPVAQMKVAPNIEDYASFCRDFRWSDVHSSLDWLPGGGLNKAYEAIDRHVVHGYGDKPALLWLGKNGEEETYTFAQFKEQSDRFANVVTDLVAHTVELAEEVVRRRYRLASA